DVDGPGVYRVAQADVPLPLRCVRQHIAFHESRRQYGERNVVQLVDGRLEIADGGFDVQIRNRHPEEFQFRAVDAGFARVGHERRDTVRRRAAVGELHVRVVGGEDGAIETQSPAGEVEFESELDGLRLFRLE